MRRASAVLLAILIPLVASCSHKGGVIAILDKTVTDRIVSGKSTKNDVRSLLGEPTEILFPSSVNENWVYIADSSDTSGLVFVPFVAAFTSVNEQHEYSLTIEFDKRGIVRRMGRGDLKVKQTGYLD